MLQPRHLIPAMPVLVAGLLVMGMSQVASAKDRQPEPPAPEVITLKFDWGAGLTAKVETTRARSRTPAASTGKGAERSLTSVSTMVAERQGDGSYIINVKDQQLSIGGEAVPAAAMNRLEALMSGALEPAIRVSATGEFIGLADYDRTRADMERIIKEFVPQPGKPEDQAQLQAILGQLMTREVMEQQVRQPWDAFVGTWTGGELELGEEYEAEGEIQVSMLSNRPIRQVSRLSITERTACDESKPSARPDCVRLQMVSKLDPEDIRKAVTALIERFAGPGKGIPDSVLKDMRIDTVIDVVANPDTMQPYRGSWSKTSVITGLEKGVEKTVTQVESTRASWVYADRAPTVAPGAAEGG